MKEPTVKDVADLAGVSAMTVSRVINNHPRIAEATAEKVREAIQELGYSTVSSQRKRGRRSRAREGIHTGVIALVPVGVNEDIIRNPVIAESMLGVRNALQDQGLTMIMSPVSDFSRLPGIMDRRSIDGVVLVGMSAPAEVKEALGDLPSVYLFALHEGMIKEGSLICDQILPDNQKVAELAADYLLDRGHKHAAFLDPSLSHPEFAIRGEGFKKRIEEAGAEVDMYVFGGQPELPLKKDLDLDREGLDEILSKFLTADKRAKAIFVPSDQVTAVIYEELQRRGVSPSDFDFISCNNEKPYLTGLYPKPATIDICGEQIGLAAVQQLMQQMKERTEPTQILIEPTLITPED